MARGEIYAQLSVDYYDNARIIAAGDDAELLYVRSLCLANRLLTDGVIMPEHLVALRLSRPERRVARLVETGLWATRTPEPGWTIVGWAERNRARVDVMVRREQAAERKRRERDRARAERDVERDNKHVSRTTSPPVTQHVTRDSHAHERDSHAPIDHRSSIIDQRSTINDQRTTNTELQVGGLLTGVAEPASDPLGAPQPNGTRPDLRAALAAGTRTRLGVGT